MEMKQLVSTCSMRLMEVQDRQQVATALLHAERGISDSLLLKIAYSSMSTLQLDYAGGRARVSDEHFNQMAKRMHVSLLQDGAISPALFPTIENYIDSCSVKHGLGRQFARKYGS
jgi:hypothetical protein